jgi:hypothetical protein
MSELELSSVRFDIEDEVSWLSYLDEHGYVVIKSVASEKEIKQGLDYLWDFLEHFPESQVRRNDPQSWYPMNGWIASAKNGLINGYGFGHSKFLWHTRMLPKVKQAFQCIWGKNEEMICSFDGGNVFRYFEYNI